MNGVAPTWTVRVPWHAVIDMPAPMRLHLEAIGGNLRWWDDLTSDSLTVAGDDTSKEVGTWLAAVAASEPAAFRLHRERHADLYG